jgi:hypothetical protein
MRLSKLGDKSRAICPFCEGMRRTSFAERDIPLSSGRGLVRDVLVAVCDTCDRVVAIPQQSVPRVKETIRYSRKALETRIPRHLLDAIGLACHELGFRTDKSAVLFRVYLQRIARTASLRKRLHVLATSAEAKGRASARFSAKLDDELYSNLLELQRISKLNKAGVVKGIIIQIKRDILDDRSREIYRDLKNILQVAA